jgi:hypothetical protein
VCGGMGVGMGMGGGGDEVSGGVCWDASRGRQIRLYLSRMSTDLYVYDTRNIWPENLLKHLKIGQNLPCLKKIVFRSFIHTS